MINLTNEQKQWWMRLQELLLENEGYLAIKKLALEIIAAQPEQDKIIVAGQTLIRFGDGQDFKNKEEFIRYHSIRGQWGDDAVLFSVLNALGYQPSMKLAHTSLPAYLPFEQPQTGLHINIVNYGAKSGGYHWELEGRSNPGDGNCMYHTVHQKVAADLPNVAKLLPNATHCVTQPTAIPEPEVSSNKEIAEEVKVTFKRFEEDAENRKQTAAKKLETFTTADLIAAYHIGLKLAAGDTYLKQRIEKYAPNEYGVDQNYFKEILENGKFSADNEYVLREVLIGALSREAWRNATAFDALNKHTVFASKSSAVKNSVEPIISPQQAPPTIKVR